MIISVYDISFLTTLAVFDDIGPGLKCEEGVKERKLLLVQIPHLPCGCSALLKTNLAAQLTFTRKRFFGCMMFHTQLVSKFHVITAQKLSKIIGVARTFSLHKVVLYNNKRLLYYSTKRVSKSS